MLNKVKMTSMETTCCRVKIPDSTGYERPKVVLREPRTIEHNSGTGVVDSSLDTALRSVELETCIHRAASTDNWQSD